MPNMSAHDAAIYAANDLITALTKPQPTNPIISIRDDEVVALQKLAIIFQTSITKQPISAPGVPDIAPPPPPPPHRPRTRSQTKKFANAALTTPQGTRLLKPEPKQPSEKKQEEDLFPEPPIDILHHNKPCIVPIISNLRPQYPTKDEGLPEDPFPPHPRSKLCHRAQHRQATQVQTTHQSPGQKCMPNVAMLE